ncbi:MAG TPA: VTT domain-containing protein [Anaerolineae bacterium]|nr:VTT domain-containing protein [Anaerolineae bacterium]
MDLVQLIQTVGYAGLFAIIFAESGLFFGFFLPGDSLLLTAGLLASRTDAATGQPILNIFILLPLLAVAAILGDNVGYWFGNKTGPRIFNRENSRLFKRKNLLAAKAFYDKHGGKTIVLARFMPFIRTFAPIVAGAVEMEYRRFVFFNFFGGLLWAVGVTLVGFGLGKAASNVAPETVDKYFLILVVAVIFVSALPAMIHIWRDNREEILRRLRRQPAPPAVEPAED